MGTCYMRTYNSRLYMNAKTTMISPTILDLPWEHVICEHILCLLDLKTCFLLRRVSFDFRSIIHLYFKTLASIDLSLHNVSRQLSSEAWTILLSDNSVCRIFKLPHALVHNDIICDFLTSNSQLRLLDISECNHLNNECLKSLTLNCRLLETLNLSNCHWVECESIVTLSTHCGRLKSLDLSGCWSVDDDAIIAVIDNCPSLSRLSLANVYGITDRAILSLSRQCPKLQHLDVRNCWRISDHAIRLLGEYCESLMSLNVADCRISEISLGRLRRRGVKLDIPPKLWDLHRLYPHGHPNIQV